MKSQHVMEGLPSNIQNFHESYKCPVSLLFDVVSPLLTLSPFIDFY